MLQDEFERWRRSNRDFGANYFNKSNESSSSSRKDPTEERGENQSLEDLEVEDEGTTGQATIGKEDITSKQGKGLTRMV